MGVVRERAERDAALGHEALEGDAAAQREAPRSAAEYGPLRREPGRLGPDFEPVRAEGGLRAAVQQLRELPERPGLRRREIDENEKHAQRRRLGDERKHGGLMVALVYVIRNGNRRAGEQAEETRLAPGEDYREAAGGGGQEQAEPARAIAARVQGEQRRRERQERAEQVRVARCAEESAVIPYAAAVVIVSLRIEPEGI